MEYERLQIVSQDFQLAILGNFPPDWLRSKFLVRSLASSQQSDTLTLAIREESRFKSSLQLATLGKFKQALASAQSPRSFEASNLKNQTLNLAIRAASSFNGSEFMDGMFSLYRISNQSINQTGNSRVLKICKHSASWLFHRWKCIELYRDSASCFSWS